jgi:hypothetical protein
MSDFIPFTGQRANGQRNKALNLMIFSFLSTFIIPCSVFCGSILSTPET